MIAYGSEETKSPRFPQATVVDRPQALIDSWLWYRIRLPGGHIPDAAGIISRWYFWR